MILLTNCPICDTQLEWNRARSLIRCNNIRDIDDSRYHLHITFDNMINFKITRIQYKVFNFMYVIKPLRNETIIFIKDDSRIKINYSVNPYTFDEGSLVFL